MTKEEIKIFESDIHDIREQILYLLKVHYETQIDLAADLNIDKNLISAMVSKTYTMSFDRFVAIYDAIKKIDKSKFYFLTPDVIETLRREELKCIKQLESTESEIYKHYNSFGTKEPILIESIIGKILKFTYDKITVKPEINIHHFFKNKIGLTVEQSKSIVQALRYGGYLVSDNFHVSSGRFLPPYQFQEPNYEMVFTVTQDYINNLGVNIENAIKEIPKHIELKPEPELKEAFEFLELASKQHGIIPLDEIRITIKKYDSKKPWVKRISLGTKQFLNKYKSATLGKSKSERSILVLRFFEKADDGDFKINHSKKDSLVISSGPIVDYLYDYFFKNENQLPLDKYLKISKIDGDLYKIFKK